MPITEELNFVNQKFVILQIYENAPQRKLENVSDLDPLSYNQKILSELFVTLSNSL